ncbi:MAG: DUF169 domain-containing protein [Thermoplasmata archaeon]|nr:DUF169 domain-containing protein [Thermoplasmata archaeon]MCI4359549.1 DUF169 domain-containing protein [Thermoplasmata archaeon]
MNDLSAIAKQLSEDLELDRPPVQVSYLNEAPVGVDHHPGGAPSVCTFFAEGTRRPFYAGLSDHEACEVGAFVLGIPPQGELGARLMGTVGMMQKVGYLAPGEEARIPRNASPPKFVAYGPLGSIAAPPTSVLIFARPRSAMFAMEAAHGPVPMNGRPMCAIVPTLNQGAPVAMSMGCIGSRVFTQMGDDRLVVGVRGDHLESFARRVREIREANAPVANEDTRRRNEAANPFRG